MRRSLEKHHRPLGQETSTTEEGQVLSRVIITKEGIESSLVTTSVESQVEEHSQAGLTPAPVENTLRRKKKRHKKTVTEEDAVTEVPSRTAQEMTIEAGQGPVLIKQAGRAPVLNNGQAVQELEVAQEMTPQAGQVPCLIKQGGRQVPVLTKGQATQVTNSFLHGV